MSAPLSPIPNTDPVIDEAQLIGGKWYLWLYDLWSRVKSSVQVVGTPFTRSAQVAALVTTTIFAVTQSGAYRVGYWLEVTQLATTSYALAVTLGWRDNGVSKSQTFASLSGAPGTLATGVQTDQLPLIRCDGGTVITMAVSYASVGATVCVWRAEADVELVN